MQSGGGFVHDVDLPSASAFSRHEFARDLDLLRFASRQGRGRLPEPQVAESHLLQLPERLTQFLLPGEEPDRLVHSELQYVVDRLPLHRDVEDIGLESAAAANVAGHEDVGHEHHFDLDHARSLAAVTATAGDVEAERARREPSLARQRLRREDAPDLVVGLHVGDRIGARRPPDRLLINQHDRVQRLRPQQRVIGANDFTQVPARRVFPGEFRLERTIQHVVHQRALAGPRHACDDGQRA